MEVEDLKYKTSVAEAMEVDAQIKKPSVAKAMEGYVGKTGFEPATPWSQTRCATGLRHFPIYPPKPRRRWVVFLVLAHRSLGEDG